MNKEELNKYKKMWAEKNKVKVTEHEKIRLNFIKKWGNLIVKEKKEVKI